MTFRCVTFCLLALLVGAYGVAGSSGWVSSLFVSTTLEGPGQFDFGAATNKWYLPDKEGCLIYAFDDAGALDLFAGQRTGCGFVDGAAAAFNYPMACVVAES